MPKESRDRRLSLGLLSRRVAATVIDYALLAAPLGVVGVWRVSTGRTAPVRHLRWSAILGVTLPGACVLALGDAHGGTPGKRLLGLRVRALGGGPPSYGATFVRALAKTALPWELGHQGVWDLNGDATRRGTTLVALAYTALGIQLAMAALGPGRTYPDLLAGTAVGPRDRTRSPAGC